MGLAHEKKSYLQEKANLFEIGSEVRKKNGGACENLPPSVWQPILSLKTQNFDFEMRLKMLQW